MAGKQDNTRIDLEQWAPEGLTGDGRAYGPLVWLAILASVDHRRGTAARDVAVRDDDLSRMTGLAPKKVQAGLASLERAGWIRRITTGRRRAIRIYPRDEADLRRQGKSDVQIDRALRLTATITDEYLPIPLPRIGHWPSETYVAEVWGLASRDRRQPITLVTLAIAGMVLAMAENHGPITWRAHELRAYVAGDIRRLAGVKSSTNARQAFEALERLGVFHRVGDGKQWRHMIVSRPTDVAARLRDRRGADAGERVLARLQVLMGPSERSIILRSYHALADPGLDHDTVKVGMDWLRCQGMVVTASVRDPDPDRDSWATRIDIPPMPLRADEYQWQGLLADDEALGFH